MNSLLRSISLLTAIALLAIGQGDLVAQGQTIGQILSKACPRAWAVDKQQERAAALNDESQYHLAKVGAGLFYDCYHQSGDSYARDAAHLEYLMLLSVSVSPLDPQAYAEVLMLVENGANDLAASTPFDDLRKRALLIRDSEKKELQREQGPPP